MSRSWAHFQHMNSTYLKFEDNTFDAVLMFEVAEHLMPLQLQRTLSEIYRVAKPGAVVLGSTPIVLPCTAPRTYAHVQEMTGQEFANIIHTQTQFVDMERYGDNFILKKRGDNG
jgi:ubiquinone/menaquinone biosynthesis C-methylase UbiE